MNTTVTPLTYHFRSRPIKTKNSRFNLFSYIFALLEKYLPNLWCPIFPQSGNTLFHYPSVTRRYSIKKILLKTSRNSQKNTCRSLRLYQKRSSGTKTFFVILRIFYSFFADHTQMAAFAL